MNNAFLRILGAWILVGHLVQPVLAATEDAPVAGAPGSEEGGVFLAGGWSRYSISARTTGWEGGGSIRGSSLLNGAGAFHTWRLDERWGFDGQLAYVRKAFTESESGGTISRGDESRLSQLRSAIVGRYFLDPHFSVGLGPYFGYGIGSAESDAPGGVERESYRDAYLNRWDIGAVLSAQARAPITPTLSLVADLRYFHGFTNLFDDERLARDTGLTGFSFGGHTRDFQMQAGLALVIPPWLGL